MTTQKKMSPYLKDNSGKDAFAFAGGDRSIMAALNATPVKDENMNL